MLRHEPDAEQQNVILFEPQKQAPVQETTIAPGRKRRTGKQSELQRWVKSRTEEQTPRRFKQVMLLFLLCFLLSLPTTALLWHLFPAQTSLGFTVGVVMMLSGIVGMPVSLIATAVKMARNAARKPMPQEQGIDAIGPLLDRMMTDIYHLTEMRARLTALLPQLQPEDAALLEPRHYEMLNADLNKHVWNAKPWQQGEKAYLLAVLEAYACIGDVRAMRDVARIAQGKVSSVVRDAEVSAAAQRCLVHLKQQEQAMRQKETLLRTSDRPAEPETLLRPTGFVPESDPQQLLRPADEHAND